MAKTLLNIGGRLMLMRDRMLAVMTFNIGFLFAVTGSVLLGDLVFGRYMRGSVALAEDGCHS